MTRRWPVLLAADVALCAALSGIFVIVLPWFQGRDAARLFPFVLWGIKPAAALGITLRFTLRGLNGYAAMALPFLCFNIVHFAMLGYAAHPAPEMLSLFTSLLGAAVGETIKARNRPPKRGNRR